MAGRLTNKMCERKIKDNINRDRKRKGECGHLSKWSNTKNEKEK